jgi:hypothetical protein
MNRWWDHRGLGLLLAAVVGLAPSTTLADLDVYAPSGMPTGKTITAEQLWQEFDHSLPPDVWVSPLESKKYEVISAKWMRRSFVPEDDTAGNCNGFALICRLMLTLSAMDSHASSPAAATVIVKQERAFGGLSATRENHCVAYVLTDEGPWIIEVQSGAYTQIGAYPNRENIKIVSVH